VQLRPIFLFSPRESDKAEKTWLFSAAEPDDPAFQEKNRLAKNRLNGKQRKKRIRVYSGTAEVGQNGTRLIWRGGSKVEIKRKWEDATQ